MRLTVKSVAWCVLATLLLCSCGGAGAQERELTLKQIIEQTTPALVRVVGIDAAGVESAAGSGFVVDARGYIVTHYRVVQQATRAYVQFKDGTRSDVKGSRALDKDARLAVLEIVNAPKGGAFLRLAEKPPLAQGDTAVALGRATATELAVAAGIVGGVKTTTELPGNLQALLPAPAAQMWVQTSMPIRRESDGGPLLDGSGRVIGVCVWAGNGPGAGFAVHVKHLAELLAKSASAQTLALKPEEFIIDPKSPFAPLAPAVREIADEHLRAMNELQRKLGEIGDPAQRQQLWRNDNPGPAAAERLLKLAESSRGSNVAFQALVLAGLIDPQSLSKTMPMLSDDFAADPLAYHAILKLRAIRHDGVTEFLRKVVDKNPDRRNKAAAVLALATSLDTPDGARSEERMKLLEQCAGEYKDVLLGDPDTGSEKAGGELARRMLVKAKLLSVGSTAQEIVGKDVDGQEFKLSDFKGKVVLLSFSASALPSADRVGEVQQALAKDYEGRPFVVLGVDCGQPEMLREAIAAKKVTGRCWADGRHGPIADAWQVRSWPTVFLIDHGGVIRRTFEVMPDAQPLGKVIDDLVEAAELATGKGAIAIGESGPEAAKMEPIRVIRKAWKPIWSPDGMTILCTKAGTGKMMFYDIRTGATRDLPITGKDAAWSPDGSLIAFVKEVGPKHQEEVWLSNKDGGEERKLADGGYPSWIGSAQNAELVYHSRKDGRMYVVAAGKPLAEPALFYDRPLSMYPAISKDATLIAFGQRERLIVVEHRTGRVVLEHVVRRARGVVSDFSPDDSMLACGGFDGDDCGLWVLDLQGHIAVRAVDGACAGAAWSDDGARLAFDKRGDNLREIWVVGRDWLIEKLKKEGTPVETGR